MNPNPDTSRTALRAIAGRPSSRALLERDAELGAIEAALRDAAAGSGRLVVVEGPAGIGKSRLLDEAVERARGEVAVLRARAMELERDYAFAVALQLFEPAVAAVGSGAGETAFRGAAQRAAPLFATTGADRLPEAPHEFSIIHGLYWLAANLADEQPLAIVVDDAHWADEASLRFCAYIAERIDELPITLVLALRRGDLGPNDELLRSLGAHSAAEVLRPAPLSGAAIATLASARLGTTPDEEFVAALADLTGGSPYFARELLAAAAEAGLSPVAAAAARVRELAPEGVLRAVARRLAALPPAATALARAVAVLGDEAKLQHAASLAGLTVEAAAEAADALADLEMMDAGERLSFRHALTTAAVDAGVPRAARAAAHLRAAEMLRDEGTPPDRLAAHLLAAPAGGRAWVVDALRAAARRTMALGAPAAAIAQLRRALDEPPTPDARADVLYELAAAETLVGDPAAAEHLAEAALAATEPRERVERLRELARTRVSLGDRGGARAAYSDAIAVLGDDDRELTAHLRAERLVVAALDQVERPEAGTVERILADEGTGATAAGRTLLASLAVHELYAGAPRDRVLALADRALAGGALLDDEGAETTSLYGIYLVLFVCEALTRADELMSVVVDRARRAGSVVGVASASYSRAWGRLIAGRVTDAVDDAQQAVDAGRQGWRQFRTGAFSVLTHALLDAGDLEGAERALAEAEEIERAGDVTDIQLVDARGRVHVRRGRHAEAAAAFLHAGELAGPQRNPLVFATWRSNAAIALARSGDRERARDLVEAELELAHAFGAPRGLAVALRAQGMIEAGDLGLRLLNDSLDVLEGSEAGLERMRSLYELGAALRRGGRRRDAGRLLGEALELARQGGAGEIERRAAEELEVAGARAVRASRRGRDALSPSERRVVQLAASGLSNREIAEELFVTIKAVEWHLRNAYAKLGISSRRELPDALRIGA